MMVMAALRCTDPVQTHSAVFYTVKVPRKVKGTELPIYSGQTDMAP